MTVLQVTMTVPNRDLVNRDSVENTWCFIGEGALPAQVTAATLSLYTFYNHLMPFMSSVMDWDKSEFKAYDITTELGGSAHGSPLATLATGLEIGTVPDAIPHGLAVVLSYHSAPGTTSVSGPADPTIPTDARARKEGAPATHAGVDRMRSRTFGRTYLGPFNSSAIGTGVAQTVKAFVSAALKAAVEAAATELLGATGAAVWGQWSRRNAQASLVTGGHAADVFGYQRLRQEKPSSFMTFGDG